MFNINLPHIHKDTFIIAYKLLHDALFLLLISFVAMLIAEGLLPGIISSHISLLKIALAIFLVLGFSIFVGKNINITYSQQAVKKNRLLPALIFLAFLLIGNSLLKFAFWENIIITLVILFLFFLFYQAIFENEK
ncbi:MAG TPA: hypothetical protein P5323_00925 [Candidatus Moranbacteria bacterium]|nr:hypothetical protein [Candidatus Moranbacteria bacterium]HRY27677.1 hypothetical protein [Candidatus Moranbacteria bacterium]HSA08000.1 hypothetical protein [Candidatus Moranbacteria bacterium]